MAIKKGVFKPHNPQKYKGNPTNIIYRSSWELRLMQKFDQRPDILEWSSEEVIIPYYDLSTRRRRRYYPDFWVRYLDKANKEHIWIIEIKPSKEAPFDANFKMKKLPPRRPRQSQMRYAMEVFRWQKNLSKWAYAKKYCEARGWRFLPLTEKEIGTFCS